MELIKRYIYAVTKRLPENTRAEVEAELQANIVDMLPDNYTEADVAKVLNKLGNPAKLAEEYRGTKNYLIGPSVYDRYINVLWLVERIVFGVVLGATLLSVLVNGAQGSNIVEVFANGCAKVLSSTIDACVQVFLWVTVAYVIVERSGMNEGQLPFTNKPWSVEKLEPIPDSHTKRICKCEVVFELVWITLCAAVLIWSPTLISVYVVQNGRLSVHEPLFIEQVLRQYVPFILAVSSVGIFKGVIKFISGQWNTLLAVVNVVHNLLVAALLSGMVNNEALINPGFKSFVMNSLHVEPTLFASAWYLFIRNFTTVVFIICVIDIVAGFWKAWQTKRLRVAV